MATVANAAPAKGGTPTSSSGSTTTPPVAVVSLLRAAAPQLRTAAALIEKHEQIQDALERSTITGKIAEQMNQTLKGIIGIEKLGLQFLSLALKFGKKAPVPRSPILRDMIGLPPQVSPSDGEAVRRLLPDAK